MSAAPEGYRWLTADEAAAWSSGVTRLSMVKQSESGDLMCLASEPVENWNCLENIRCPNCGNTERFLVDAIVTAEVTDDGAEPADGNFQYDGDAPASCPPCGFEAEWREFWINRPHRYTLTVTFEANRELTQAEADALVATVETQVQEPVVIDGPDGDWEPAEWESSRVIGTVTPLL